ncbi:MAG: hypothetical protein GX262_03030 [Clostridia bacterium]|nr:hypothetical protein [Clostridia bacterium]
MEKTKRIDWEELWPRLLGLYPFIAEDGGNYTAVLLTEGEELVDSRKTKTVLAHLARNFALDLTLVKARGQKVLCCRREVPLVLLPELVLLPVKRREAPMKDAGSLGYVVLSQIAGWEEAKDPPYRTRIAFHHGGFMEVLTTPGTFRKKVAEAELVLGDYHRRHHPPQHLPGYPVSYGWPVEGQPALYFRERLSKRGYTGHY